MTYEKHTIACLICNDEGEYHTGNGWDKSLLKGCLYTAEQAERRIKEFAMAGIAASVCCVIQNKAFNFFDGEQFVYDVLQAKLYSMNDAFKQLRSLATS